MENILPAKRTLGLFSAAIALIAGMAVVLSGVVFAGHNGAVVVIDNEEPCGETTFTASIADPDGTHKVGNMRLVVYDGEDTHVTDVIPTDGSAVEIAVGPFGQDTTVQWRVFGGGERDYDQPLWNGHGEPGFADDINAYGAEHGFGFVIAGPDDPNPFTTWNEVVVPGCFPVETDECKDGGWADFGFRNQGQCIRFVNTGMDSR